MLAEALVYYLLVKPDFKDAPDYEMVSGPPFETQQECEKEKLVNSGHEELLSRDEGSG